MPQLHDNCACLKDMDSLSQLWMSGMETSTKQSDNPFLCFSLPFFQPSILLHIFYVFHYICTFSLTLLVHIPHRPFLNFSICLLVWSCVLVLALSYYVIINHRSSIPVINNASTWSTKDAWKNPDLFLMSKMHRMQIWKKPTIINPKSQLWADDTVSGSMSLKLILFSSASSNT